uniref:LRRNT domain-containing protein n=1 Tax=Gopherus evgoodei TaxID=1825980 RepID=A0A8C4VSD7_9SAUR
MFFLILSLFPCAARIGLGVSVAACPSMCKCSPEDTIRCNKAGLRTLPAELATSAVSLNLSNNLLRILTANTFRNLTFLRSLWLDRNNLTFLYPGTFSALSNLRELDLGWNSPFRSLSTLYELNLRKNRIWTIQNDAFAMLNRLGLLDLGHNHISDLPNQLFSGLIQLKTMHLEANKIIRINCSFNSLRNLRKLYLNNNHISSISQCAFPVLHNQTLLDVFTHGELINCSIPPGLASADKCKETEANAAAMPHAISDELLWITLMCCAWHLAETLDKSFSGLGSDESAFFL